MKRNKFYILSLIVAFVALWSNFAFAENVQWRMIIKMSSSTEGIVILKASVEPGWHMYGAHLPKGGPSPTTFDFNKSSGIEFVGSLLASPRAVSSYDSLFDMTLSWWEGMVTFKRSFKRTSTDGVVSCEIKYMTCDNTRCSMPSSITLSKSLPK